MWFIYIWYIHIYMVGQDMYTYIPILHTFICTNHTPTTCHDMYTYIPILRTFMYTNHTHIWCIHYSQVDTLICVSLVYIYGTYTYMWLICIWYIYIYMTCHDMYTYIPILRTFMCTTYTRIWWKWYSQVDTLLCVSLVYIYGTYTYIWCICIWYIHIHMTCHDSYYRYIRDMTEHHPQQLYRHSLRHPHRVRRRGARPSICSIQKLHSCLWIGYIHWLQSRLVICYKNYRVNF